MIFRREKVDYVPVVRQERGLMERDELESRYSALIHEEDFHPKPLASCQLVLNATRSTMAGLAGSNLASER